MLTGAIIATCLIYLGISVLVPKRKESPDYCSHPGIDVGEICDNCGTYK